MAGAIPMHDLAAPGPADADAADVRAALDRVLASGRFILGPEVDALERELAAHLAARAAIGCASGTDALVLALLALGVGRGDEVVTTAFSFVATAEAIARVGATPVFADVDPHTFTLDPRSAAARVGPKTRALLPVHLYGHPADLPALLTLADARGLAVVEDAAQAIGARTAAGEGVGTVGDLGALSFYPTKNLAAPGDAGAVLVGARAGADAERLAARVRSLRVHGSGPEPDVYLEVGLNSRLDALHAAVLRARLPRLAEWTEARRRNAATYDRLLAGVPGLVRPTTRAGVHHVYNQYTIRVPDRDRLRARLTEAGIGSAVYYAVPLHLQPCFAACGAHGAPGDCPEAERAAREVLSLPIRPALTADELERVAAVVAEHCLRG